MAPGMTSAYGIGVPQAPFAVAQNPWLGQPGISHSSYTGFEVSPWGRIADQASAWRNAQSYQSYPWGISQVPVAVGL